MSILEELKVSETRDDLPQIGDASLVETAEAVATMLEPGARGAYRLNPSTLALLVARCVWALAAKLRQVDREGVDLSRLFDQVRELAGRVAQPGDLASKEWASALHDLVLHEQDKRKQLRADVNELQEENKRRVEDQPEPGLADQLERDWRPDLDDALGSLRGNQAALEAHQPAPDPWANRSATMRCQTCMWFVAKPVTTDGGLRELVERKRWLGRCRRHAPTMSGYPVVWTDDWCGEHKLDENAVL